VVLAYRTLGFIVARLPEYSFPHEAEFPVNLPVLLFSVSWQSSPECSSESFPRWSRRGGKSIM
jgi:hypothetical protein